jgi:hypothetical protein
VEAPTSISLLSSLVELTIFTIYSLTFSGTHILFTSSCIEIISSFENIACKSSILLSNVFKICFSSSFFGYETTILNKNLSNCASGKGKVHSCSSGFCVAITKNGLSNLKVWFQIVTFFSCIASKSAD